MNDSEEQKYEAPELREHGTAEDVTRDASKPAGSHDFPQDVPSSPPGHVKNK